MTEDIVFQVALLLLGAALIGMLAYWLKIPYAIALVIGVATLFAPRDGLNTTPRERVVLAWGGLRGALTVALALALPVDVPERDLLITMAFGVVLFTLVVQGLTLPLVIRRLGLVQAASSSPREDRGA